MGIDLRHSHDFHAATAIDLYSRFMQPKPEFRIVLCGEKTSACLCIVKPLDQGLLARLSDDRLDNKVVVVREFDSKTRFS